MKLVAGRKLSRLEDEKNSPLPFPSKKLADLPVILPGATGQPWIEFEVGINSTVFNVAIEHHFTGPKLVPHHLSTRRYREQTLLELARISPDPKTFETFICDTPILEALVSLTRNMVTKMRVSAPWTIKLRQLWTTLGTTLSPETTSQLDGRTPDLPTSMLSVIEEDNLKHIGHYQCLYSIMKLGVDSADHQKELLLHLTRVLESALIRSLAGPAKLPAKATAQMKREQKLQNAADTVVAGITSVLVLFDTKFGNHVAKKTEIMPLIAQAIRCARLPLLLDSAYSFIRWLGVEMKSTITSHGIFDRLIYNTEDPEFVSRLRETEELLAEFGYDVSSNTVQKLLVALNEDIEAVSNDIRIEEIEEGSIELPNVAEKELPSLVSGVVDVMKTYNSDAPVAFITALAAHPDFSAEILSTGGYIDCFTEALVSHRSSVLRSAPLFERYFLTPMIRQSNGITPRGDNVPAIARYFRGTSFWEGLTKAIEKLVSNIAVDPKQPWTTEGQCLRVSLRTAMALLALGPKECMEEARQVGFFSRALVPLFDSWTFPNLSKMEYMELFVQFACVMDRALIYMEKENFAGEGDLSANANTGKDAGDESDSAEEPEDDELLPSSSSTIFASREALRTSFIRVFGYKHHDMDAGAADWEKGVRSDANRLNLARFFPTVDSWTSLSQRYHEPGNEVPLTALRAGWHLFGYEKRSDALEMINRVVLPLITKYHPKLKRVLTLPLRIRTPAGAVKQLDFAVGKKLEEFDLPDTSEIHTVCCTSTEYMKLFEYSATIISSSEGSDPAVLAPEVCLWMWWQMEVGMEISAHPETFTRSKGTPKASKFEKRTNSMLPVWDTAMARVANLSHSDIADPRIWYLWPGITNLFMSSKVVAASPGGVTRIPAVAELFAKRLTAASTSIPLLEMVDSDVALDMILKNCSLATTKQVAGSWFFDSCRTLISASSGDLSGPDSQVVALIIEQAESSSSEESVVAKLLHQLALLLLNLQLTRIALKPTDILSCSLTQFAADTEVRYFCTNWIIQLFLELPSSVFSSQNTLNRLAEASMILILEPETHLAESGLQLYECLFEAQPSLFSQKSVQQCRRVWDEPHFWMTMAKNPAKLLRWMAIRQDSVVADEMTQGQMSYIVAEYTHQLRNCIENEESWKKTTDEEYKTTESSSSKRSFELPNSRESATEWMKQRIEHPKLEYASDMWWPKLLKEVPRKTQCAATFVEFSGKLAIAPTTAEETIHLLIEAILECLKRSRTSQNASKRSPLMPEYGFLLFGRSVGPRFSEAGTRRVAPSLQTDWTTAEYVIKPSSFERAAMRKSAIQLPSSKVFKLYEEYALAFSYGKGDTRHLEYLSNVLPNLPTRFFPDGPAAAKGAKSADKKAEIFDKMIVEILCSLVASGHSIPVSATSGILRPLTRFLMRFSECQTVEDAQKRCSDVPFISMHLPRFLCATAAVVSKITGMPLHGLYTSLSQYMINSALKDAENRLNTEGLKSNLESLFCLVRYDWRRYEAAILPDLIKLIHVVASDNFDTDSSSVVDGRPTPDVITRIAAFIALYEPDGEREPPKFNDGTDPKMSGGFYRTIKFTPEYTHLQHYPASNWSTEASAGEKSVSSKSKKNGPASPSIDIDAAAVRFIARSCLSKETSHVDLCSSQQFPVYITKHLFVNLRQLIVEPSLAASSLDLIWKPTVLSPSSCPEPSD